MLKSCFQRLLPEAGCDEAGRGCLAGPVFAAAVLLPVRFRHPLLNDSKQMREKDRIMLRKILEEEAIAWAVASASHHEIDRMNILQATMLAMHRAITDLTQKPGLLLIDGNRFKIFPGIPHKCFIGGDGIFASIAAASVLAKTCRDDFMMQLDEKFPGYDWKHNKGYGTARHRSAIRKLGPTPYHRMSFTLVPGQNELPVFNGYQSPE